DFLSPAELDRLLAMGTARLGGESPDAVQVRIRHREGRWIDVEASSSLYPDGESVGVLVEVRVVTEELRLQQALLSSYSPEELDANPAISQRLSNIYTLQLRTAFIF
ncbi:MAG: PAS domain S-box protein, partial [Myxococcota bacterium]|nr:PAS domain S-box protein [Myxococcota bacterium]